MILQNVFLFSCPKLHFTTQAPILTTLRKRPFENIVGKGDNAHNQNFLLFPSPDNGRINGPVNNLCNFSHPSGYRLLKTPTLYLQQNSLLVQIESICRQQNREKNSNF